MAKFLDVQIPANQLHLNRTFLTPGTTFRKLNMSSRTSPRRRVVVESPGELERLADSLEAMETEDTNGASPTNLFASPNSERGFSESNIVAAATAAADAVLPNTQQIESTCTGRGRT